MTVLNIDLVPGPPGFAFYMTYNSTFVFHSPHGCYALNLRSRSVGSR